MKKNLIILCSIACLIFFMLVVLSCDQPANKPATPKIVRKKIRGQTNETAPAPQVKTVKKSQPSPQDKPAAGPSVTGQPEPTSPAPVLARKSEAPALKTGEGAKPKPPVTPQSDISTGPLPAPVAPGGKAVSGQPETPSDSQTASAGSSTQQRPIYNPKGKIDPFEPLFREKPVVAVTKKKRDHRVPRTPLEKIDLSQLKLVGIILAASGNKALVEESNGKGYVIKAGTYVGTNAGKVVKIEKDKVIVAEEYEDVLGNVTVRNKELKLPKPPGEF